MVLVMQRHPFIEPASFLWLVFLEKSLEGTIAADLATHRKKPSEQGAECCQVDVRAYV